MRVPHHLLPHLGVRQETDAASLFDLIHDPVPVTRGFQGDRHAWREAADESPDRAGFVVDPGLLGRPASVIKNGEERVVLVRITADPIMGTASTCSTSFMHG